MRTQPLTRVKALAISTVAALAFASPLDAQSLSLLYAQDANCVAGETVSQAYEPAYQSFSVQLADDVTVPANDSWEIARVYARGAYFNGTGPAASVNVAFLADATGAPGTPIASCNYVALTSLVDAAGEFTITLPSACPLSGGTVGTRYWLVVQARMDLPTGQWGWRDRGPQTGAPAYWRNPPGGYVTDCGSSWGVRTTCVPHDLDAPDQCFALRGTSTEIVFSDGFDGN